LERLGVKKFEVCYNVLNSVHLQKKTRYQLHQPPRIIYVGRLIAEKNPENIIRAVAALPETVLTIVGDGPIRLELEQLVSDLGLAARVRFRPSVLNDELCHLLTEQDIFAVHSDYWEISKSVLEALLTGLPVVINQRLGPAVPELEGDFVMKVENSSQGYLGAFLRLLSDDSFREALGKKAFSHARAHWSPEVTEKKYAGIYRSFLQRSNGR
jgi:glycosyltransferase involved in cell wall biosynthesis